MSVESHGSRKAHWQWAENEIEVAFARCIIRGNDLLQVIEWSRERIREHVTRTRTTRGPHAAWVAARHEHRLNWMLDVLMTQEAAREAVVTYYAKLWAMGLEANQRGCAGCRVGCR